MRFQTDVSLFTTLDLSKGYWNLTLELETMKLTAFGKQFTSKSLVLREFYNTKEDQRT